MKVSKGLVYSMFCLIFAMVAISNLDHGAVPAATIPLAEDLNLTHDELGFFGSLVFFGLICGSAVGTCIMDKVSYKLLMSATLGLNAVSLWIFAMCSNYYLLCGMRFVAGFA